MQNTLSNTNYKTPSPVGEGRGGVCFDAVILCDGNYPVARLPLEILRSSSHVICCDGATRAYVRHERRMPWRIVGDGDSLGKSFRKRFASIFRHVADQETNDQTKATLYAQTHGLTRLAYIGSTGKCEDHTLGNISLLIDYMHKGLHVRMFTDHGIFIPCHNVYRHSCLPGTKVSIFNFGARNFRSEGLQYPLPELSTWWQGTLNKTTDPDFCIQADGDFLVFVNY